MEFWGAVCHTGDVTGQNPFLHRRLWGRKHTNQQARGSGGNLEDPGGGDTIQNEGEVVLIMQKQILISIVNLKCHSAIRNGGECNSV